MPIHLLVLSGRRQGEEFQFRQSRISVGWDRESDIRFHGRRSPGAKNKQAELFSDIYGWHVCNQGEGDWYINQTVLPMLDVLPLRSGDIIRLSEIGPDLRFAIVADDSPPDRPVDQEPLPADEERPPTDEEPDDTDAIGLRLGHTENVSVLGIVVPLTVLGIITLVAVFAIRLVMAR